jgi:hypothetical protein
MLQISPYIFLRIKLRCVRGKVLECHPADSIQRQELHQLFALVDPDVVPHDQNIAWNMEQDVAQEFDDASGAE